MKILFITQNNDIDYLCNSVFHGLVSIFDNDVIDSNYLWYMSDCDYTNNQNLLKLYGKGFTWTKILPDRTNIDRSNIEDKINEHYFDLIVYGSIHRCNDYLDLVFEKYNFNEIIFLDGEDSNLINYHLLKGIYFKRELNSTYDYYEMKNKLLIVYPISFSIPKSKFLPLNFNKKRLTSELIPGNNVSYTYDNENEYYKQYNESYFAFTMKKGGWDCMRHYEIIASGCLPYFKNIHEIPKTTMINWPIELQIRSNFIYQKCLNNDFDYFEYYNLLSKFYDYALNNLSTESIIKYIINMTLNETVMSKFNNIYTK